MMGSCAIARRDQRQREKKTSLIMKRGNGIISCPFKFLSDFNGCSVFDKSFFFCLTHHLISVMLMMIMVVLLSLISFSQSVLGNLSIVFQFKSLMKSILFSQCIYKSDDSDFSFIFNEVLF